jgi:hypothetical protein
LRAGSSPAQPAASASAPPTTQAITGVAAMSLAFSTSRFGICMCDAGDRIDAPAGVRQNDAGERGALVETPSRRAKSLRWGLRLAGGRRLPGLHAPGGGHAGSTSSSRGVRPRLPASRALRVRLRPADARRGRLWAEGDLRRGLQRARTSLHVDRGFALVAPDRGHTASARRWAKPRRDDQRASQPPLAAGAQSVRLTNTIAQSLRVATGRPRRHAGTTEPLPAEYVGRCGWPERSGAFDGRHASGWQARGRPGVLKSDRWRHCCARDADH